MELQRQIQVLLQEAPQDGQTPEIVRAIAPVLLQLAQRLKNTEYHLLQSLDQRWQVTTLQHRSQQGLEKAVIYAFGSAKDAAMFGNRQLLITAKPVIQLLFQLLALEGVDSLIFMDTPGDQNKGIEIQRQELQELVQAQLRQYATDNPIPVDLA
jgi:UTP-glucose-1-phosphate uridylyltransferase